MKDRKVEIRIGTLKIVSLSGKVEEIVGVIKKRKINILGLNECVWQSTGETQLRDRYKLSRWSGGPEGRNGVGIIIIEEGLKDFATNVVYNSARSM
jgi:hypothetical protein